MKALFISKNLLGDALSISPALRAWHFAHPDWGIDLMTLPDQIADIYSRMGVPLRVITEDSERQAPYDFEFTFDVGKAFMIGDMRKKHIIDAYAELLFGPDHTMVIEPAPTFIPIEEDHQKGLFLISPFSRSCSSNEGKPPNKKISWQCWLQIMTLLRSVGPIGCLGGPGDHAPLPIFENEYYCGLSLNKVALMLRDAKLLVTIDNGIAHMAVSQKTPMIEFYPECLGIHWVPPAGNPMAFIAQTNPAVMQPHQAAQAVRGGMLAIKRRSQPIVQTTTAANAQ